MNQAAKGIRQFGRACLPAIAAPAAPARRPVPPVTALRAASAPACRRRPAAESR